MRSSLPISSNSPTYSPPLIKAGLFHSRLNIEEKGEKEDKGDKEDEIFSNIATALAVAIYTDVAMAIKLVRKGFQSC